MAPRNTIFLRGYVGREEAGIATGSALIPGDLVELVGPGRGIRRHNADGGAIPAVLVVRESHENNGAGIDVAIPAGSEAVYIVAQNGDKLNMRTTETIARGDHLTSAGDGTVRVRETGEALLGVADGPDDEGRVAVIIGGAAPSESA